MPIRHRYRRTSAAARLTLALAAFGLMSGASPAGAQPAPPRASAAATSEATGVVLEIQNDELILNVGSDRGLASGDKVELWRPIKLKHPVTGQLFTDRFLLGTLELGQVRPSMSLSKAIGSLWRDPQIGDVVIAASLSGASPAKAATPARPAAPQPSTAPKEPNPYDPPSTPAATSPAGAAPSAAEPPSREDTEAIALGKMMDNLRGADPVKRIRAYEDYVRAVPKGRFARVLYEEAASLRRILDADRPRASEQAAQKPKETPLLVRFERPSLAVGGQPLRVSALLSDEATGAVLHVRGPSQARYSSLPMDPMGGGYFGATIPAEQMNGAEAKYFIEATGGRAEPAAVLGSAEEPIVIEIQEPPLFGKPKKRDAKVAILTDYADYNVGEGNDWAWQTEGYFQIRYGDTGIRAIRSGFGVYRGEGGTVSELDDQHLKPRKIGLTYGYLEMELGVVKAFSFLGKMAVGLDEDGMAGGGQLMLRIGSDRQTNLLIGGEILGGVGLRGTAQLELNTFKTFPMLFGIEVTNQPAGAGVSAKQSGDDSISRGSGQVGGRGIAQIGWRVLDPLVISVRGSFQGRTIKHAGPGGGAAVSYQW